MFTMTASTITKENSYALETLRRLNILLVEDNALNAKLLSMLFTQQGIPLQLAANGKEAIDKIKNMPVDMVLMDMEMPVMNGYEATTIIRHVLHNDIPIIALTAHTSKTEKEKCLQLGMNEYVSKPIDAALLFKTMHDLTGNSKTILAKTGIVAKPVSSAADVKVCNLDYLVGATRGNKKIMHSIVAVFFKETGKELILLNDAIKKNNYDSIGEISHKIKSAFSILGISVLEPVFKEIEQLSSNASGIEKIEQLNQTVNTVFKRAKAEMKDNF